MINKILAFLFAITFSVQAEAALNNPFNKTTSVNAGSDIKWNIEKGIANKTTTISDKDGTYYQLRLTQSELSLRLLSSAAGSAKSFDQLTINDVQFDGKSSTLFQWCLNNQPGHNRFLQQGLKINKDICQNKGQQGLFVIKLNQATYNILQKTKNITFTVKPYRGTVEASFDVPDMSNVFAQLAGGGKAVVSKKTVTPKKKAAVKAKSSKLCSIKPPTDFASIKAIKYICNNGIAKATARKNMASNVKKARAKKARLASERKQKSKQSEAQRLAQEEKKKKEAEAVLLSEKNRNKIQGEVSQKMIGMCKKKWSSGEHRCYCEPYLEFAPAGIKSNPSCSGG